jgi:hypothetical protein
MVPGLLQSFFIVGLKPPWYRNILLTKVALYTRAVLRSVLGRENAVITSSDVAQCGPELSAGSPGSVGARS